VNIKRDTGILVDVGDYAFFFWDFLPVGGSLPCTGRRWRRWWRVGFYMWFDSEIALILSLK
jgi:hypothetical protein